MQKLIKSLLFFVCLVPAGWLLWSFFTDNLGANPFEVLTRDSGEWTLRFILLTLLMTPLRSIFNWSWPLRVRRMLGLYAFFYASLHLLTYLWFDQFFDWNEIATDIAKRPFITAGITAWLLLLPLAVTSTNYMMKKLGKKWKKLHRLVYPIGILGIIHFFWLVKADLIEPIIYGLILFSLLVYRFIKRKRIKMPSFSTKHAIQ